MDHQQANNSMKKRVTDLIDIFSDGLYEREEIIAVSLLSALSGQSIFLYGLPGTAKSLIARRISNVFKDTTHFEYLMQRFSTPEDVFGPVSIRELKKDNYIRKTEGYLPTADFAFLDEIWKSSPAILNTLLTIINERIYRNGGKDEKVPLKALIAASNETPPPNQGLEALYDRFVMRIIVNPMEERENFEKLLAGDAVPTDIEIPDGLQFSHDEFEQLSIEIVKVTISKEVFAIINSIRVSLDEFNKENPKIAVYVSDRRWQKIALILKTSAFLCDRTEVITVDALILRHCLWTLEQNREPINEVIEKCVKQFGCANNEKLNSWELNHKDLEKGISDTFFYTENIYDTQKKEDVLNYGGSSGYDNDSFVKWFDSTPPIKIKKGSQKAVDSRTKGTFVKACEDSLSSLAEIINNTKSNVDFQKKLNDTPFVPSEKRELVFDVFNSFLKDLENHKLNAERLLEKVQAYAISK